MIFKQVDAKQVIKADDLHLEELRTMVFHDPHQVHYYRAELVKYLLLLFYLNWEAWFTRLYLAVYVNRLSGLLNKAS